MPNTKNGKKIKVKQSKPHRRSGGWVKGGKGYVRKESRVTVNRAYTRTPPSKKPKTKPIRKKKTRQTRFGTPRKRPTRRSLLKRKI